MISHLWGVFLCQSGRSLILREAWARSWLRNSAWWTRKQIHWTVSICYILQECSPSIIWWLLLQQILSKSKMSWTIWIKKKESCFVTKQPRVGIFFHNLICRLSTPNTFRDDLRESKLPSCPCHRLMRWPLAGHVSAHSLHVLLTHSPSCYEA